MRARRSLLVMFLGVILLSGCVPRPAAQPPEPAPSNSPVFASEEEALAAAVAAYEAYLKVSDEIAADGGAHPERLKDLVTEEWYEKEVEVFHLIGQAGIHQDGASTARNAELQQISLGQLTINICADASATRYLDANGVDVTSADRYTLVTNEVLFQIGPEQLLLVSSTPWRESSLC